MPDGYDIKQNGGFNNGTRAAIKEILVRGLSKTHAMTDRDAGVYYLQQLDIVSTRLRLYLDEPVKQGPPEVFNDLASKQTELEPEFTKAMMENLTELYEVDEPAPNYCPYPDCSCALDKAYTCMKGLPDKPQVVAKTSPEYLDIPSFLRRGKD